MQIRRAVDNDTEAIRSIYNAEVLGSTATTDLVARTKDENEAFLAAHSGAYPIVVAENAGTLLGFASLSPYRSRPAYSTTAEDSIYVDAPARGRGVGTAMLAELSALARAHGFHSVIARIVTEQVASIALHKRAGFDSVGIERAVARKFGRWLDVQVMQLMVLDLTEPHD